MSLNCLHMLSQLRVSFHLQFSLVQPFIKTLNIIILALMHNRCYVIRDIVILMCHYFILLSRIWHSSWEVFSHWNISTIIDWWLNRSIFNWIVARLRWSTPTRLELSRLGLHWLLVHAIRSISFVRCSYTRRLANWTIEFLTITASHAIFKTATIIAIHKVICRFCLWSFAAAIRDWNLLESLLEKTLNFAIDVFS